MTVNPARVQRLMDHGLTEYEARGYLALLELESAEASHLSDLSRVPRTKIYQALEGLEQKKLLRVIPERPKRYVVEPFSNYLDELERQFRARAENIVTNKDSLAEEFAPKGNFQMTDAGNFIVLKGRANITSRMAEMLAKAGKDVSVLASAAAGKRLDYHHTTLQEAMSRGAEGKLLCPYTEKNEQARELLGDVLEIRESFVNLGAVTLLFVDDREVLFAHHVPDDTHYFQGSDVALWSDDPTLVKTLKGLFLIAWALSAAPEEAVAPVRAELENAMNTAFASAGLSPAARAVVAQK
ncbi:MAG TPA: helix-turn-helix domain-containing protein [Candidatus Thermoplasmatota archaeon]|nr:helix-turn-helix domain-containing protein [Candidatus Thermoplasmatota archaeon]